MARSVGGSPEIAMQVRVSAFIKIAMMLLLGQLLNQIAFHVIIIFTLSSGLFPKLLQGHIDIFVIHVQGTIHIFKPQRF